MNVLAASDMTATMWKEWSEARKKLYRGVLADPRTSEEQKEQARKKLESTRSKKV